MPDEGAGERPVVLVAEDEALTRMAMVATLREAGYDTIEAISGPRAMLALEETAAVRVLLTDIAMPLGFDGITLAACVRRRWPDVGIVMTSGEVRPVPGDVPAGARFLAKPYRAAELLEAIAQQVHGCRAGGGRPPAPPPDRRQSA